MVRAIPVDPNNNTFPPPAKKAKIENDETNNADALDDTATSIPPKQTRGRRSKKTPSVDGALFTSATPRQDVTAAIYAVPPPPPPPPPPPADNPYYKKFVEAYWQKYGSDAWYSTVLSQSIPPPPPSMPFFPPPISIPLIPPAAAAATEHPAKKSPASNAPSSLPPLSLSQEFPINTDRPSFFLGNPARDPSSLSQKSCYVRTRLFEAFLARPSDRTQQKHAVAGPPRLGLRCVYCALRPPKSRAERSSTHPSSVKRLYHAVADMQHRHLERCAFVPLRVRERVLVLNSNMNRQRVGEGVSPKVYWEECAKEMGMEDVVEEGRSVGIRLREGHGMIPKTWEMVVRWFGREGEEEEGKSQEDGGREEKTEGNDDDEVRENKSRHDDDEVKENKIHHDDDELKDDKSQEDAETKENESHHEDEAKENKNQDDAETTDKMSEDDGETKDKIMSEENDETTDKKSEDDDEIKDQKSEDDDEINDIKSEDDDEIKDTTSQDAEINEKETEHARVSKEFQDESEKEREDVIQAVDEEVEEMLAHL